MTPASGASYTAFTMRRPPGKMGPILSHSPNDWINRIATRHRTFAALDVTADERRQLDAWLVSRFVAATLQLEPAATPHVNTNLTNAVSEAMRLAGVEGRAARLTPDLLVKLNGADVRERDGHEARRAQAIEIACDWFAAESFAELNPVEQAAIVFVRLATVRPFEQANRATALVAASLFTLRAELPPVILTPAAQAALPNALAEADCMNMQPLVELIADAIISALDEMTVFVEKVRGG